MHWEGVIGGAEASNKMILECSDGTFGGVLTIDM